MVTVTVLKPETLNVLLWYQVWLQLPMVLKPETLNVLLWYQVWLQLLLLLQLCYYNNVDFFVYIGGNVEVVMD